MATAWTKTCELGYSPILQMLAESFYRKVFPKCTIIRLTKSGAPHILDKQFHIDVILKQKNGMQVTMQEKFRSLYALKWCDFTLEYESNQHTHVLGEWFHLCTDLYTYGWATKNQESFQEFYIFKVFPFKNAVIKGTLKPKPIQENESFGDATFYPFPFSKFPDSWFLLKYKKNKR